MLCAFAPISLVLIFVVVSHILEVFIFGKQFLQSQTWVLNELLRTLNKTSAFFSVTKGGLLLKIY